MRQGQRNKEDIPVFVGWPRREIPEPHGHADKMGEEQQSNAEQFHGRILAADVLGYNAFEENWNLLCSLQPIYSALVREFVVEVPAAAALEAGQIGPARGAGRFDRLPRGQRNLHRPGLFWRGQ